MMTRGVPVLDRDPDGADARQAVPRDGWVYEEKYDGWRMIAYKNGSAVRLVTFSISII
jgi:ATP-dependent DNA ligase